MTKAEAEQLINKYLSGNCSEQETALIESWYNQLQPEVERRLTDEEWKQDVSAIIGQLEKQTTPHRRIFRSVRVAAVACLFFGTVIAGYYFMRHPAGAARTQLVQLIKPGGNKAVLTLANGKKVILNDAGKGVIATEEGATVTKTADGMVAYKENDRTSGSPAGLNTMSTPRGGQYQLLLADGTKVWLNAASSITYPSNFSGQSRDVTVTGEVYFEVAHNAAKPFHVKSGGQEITVLGTRFNINTYNDEPVAKTTLLEGSVKLNGKYFLKPGEQARLSGESIQISMVDTENVIAWKNNKFMFENNDVKAIMRMISRWYDVQIDYSGAISDEKFSGSVSRFSDVSTVLSILELTENVHFKVDGRRIEVKK